MTPTAFKLQHREICGKLKKDEIGFVEIIKIHSYRSSDDSDITELGELVTR